MIAPPHVLIRVKNGGESQGVIFLIAHIQNYIVLQKLSKNTWMLFAGGERMQWEDSV